MSNHYKASKSIVIISITIRWAFVSYLYARYGRESSKGNNLIIERINQGAGNIPFRMAPLVFFGTPIGGTIFGLEVSTVGKMRYEAIIPCFIASYTGNFVAKLFKMQHSHYNIVSPINGVDVF